MLGFTLDGQPPRGDYPWGTGFYAGVRVMPDDDYSSVPAERRLSWEFIYETVIRYYYLLYPAMSQVFPLNDEESMREAAKEIIERTDPRHWLSTQYMPMSRDLSAGKRKLLVDWANSVIAGQG